jgi:gliding motility-associated-like protein
MKKLAFIILILIGFILPASANHIKGGFFTYHYLGPGINDPSKLRYQVTLTVYMECNPPPNPMQLDSPINFTIFDGGTNLFLQTVAVPITNQYVLSKSRDEPCITGNQAVCYYTIVEYNLPSIELSPNANGYTFSYQRCCRIGGIVNIQNSVSIGNTWSITIPGTSVFPGAETNSSPRFLINDTVVICAGNFFQYPFFATDPDSDSLTYEFCDAWTGASSGAAAPVQSSPPPYTTVPYQLPYSGTQPMGSQVTINRQTGLISGVAPAIPGEYVITVCLHEYRSGVLIASTRKELHIRAGDCQPITPQLDPTYITCDGFTLTFQNNNPNPLIQTYYWDFGVPIAIDDTSDKAVPTYTYNDTGTYTIKLIINRGLGCSDSTTAIAKVYPGFFPGFLVNGICIGKPTLFTDTTKTKYGVVDSWRWDFGVTTLTNDTSRLQNPSYTYPQQATYNVRFIVTNSKGCTDTAFKDVTIIDKPPLSLAFKDTLICNVDDVQLQAIGNGLFSWTPLVNIINPNTATPTVHPPSTTWYYVQLDDNGCLNRDSVRVRVVNTVTLNARNDTTICANDPVQLGATTDGFKFLWAPAATLDNPNILNPVATPANTTTYQVTSSIGSCSATDNVTVTVVAYPIANAGRDTTICYNSSAQLNGSMGGTSFSWSPPETLNNPAILNPIATPAGTTAYVLSVNDVVGCPKPGRDTVLVTVLPKINAFAGNDTLIVVDQPLQLLASGGTNYLWSPPTGLSAVDISDPIAHLIQSIDSIRYKVIVSDQANCTDSAFINVKVFKTNPYIFVPTAFTPNGDGLNDVIRPIAVGMKQINYFQVYNRWGQMVFSTQINGQGWNGMIGGKPQNTGVYVWLVRGVDYLNRPFFLKGTVTLIR